jgi:hypothetical protein
MNLDDLKERFTSEAKMLWERVEESSAYNQLRDRYENMTPSMQKLSVVGASALVALIVLSIPYSYFSQSTAYEQEFESRRSTIRELLKVSRESSEVPALQQAPSTEALRSLIDSQIQNAHFLPEQIKGTEVISETTRLVPQNLTAGMVQVRLAKLNLRQVLDFGYQMQSLNPSVKVKDMVMTANREDSRYYDVLFKLVALAVPNITGEEEAGGIATPPARGSRARGGR